MARKAKSKKTKAKKTAKNFFVMTDGNHCCGQFFATQAQAEKEALSHAEDEYSSYDSVLVCKQIAKAVPQKVEAKIEAI